MRKSIDWSQYLLPVAAIVAPAAASTFVAPACVYAADYLTVPQAQAALFPEARGFSDRALHLSDADRDRVREQSGVKQRWDTQAVWRAERDGQTLGWLIVDDVVGKHEFITYAAAISPEGKVLGIEILSYRETHGGQVREAQWRRNFVGKKLGDSFKLDEDIPNISGATLSCRNLTDGVKRLLVLHKLFLAHG